MIKDFNDMIDAYRTSERFKSLVIDSSKDIFTSMRQYVMFDIKLSEGLKQELLREIEEFKNKGE
jgi:hypothetical protein